MCIPKINLEIDCERNHEIHVFPTKHTNITESKKRPRHAKLNYTNYACSSHVNFLIRYSKIPYVWLIDTDKVIVVYVCAHYSRP